MARVRLLSGRLVALADVLAGAVQAAQQVPQVGGERVVALGAAQPARFPEVLERRAARRAAQPIGGRRGQPGPAPVPTGDETAQRGILHRAPRLDALLLGARLTERE